MIRSDYNISDKEFNEIMDDFEDELYSYVRTNFLYEYLAFYIAKGYEMSALWKGKLSGHFNSALDRLCELDIDSSDYSKIKEILKDKYSLNIIDEKTTSIEKIK